MSDEELIKLFSDEELVYTENGALAYANSGDALVDLNYAVSSLRNADEDSIIGMFMAALKAHPMLTMRWLFFARDPRGGLGERRLFKVIFTHLANHYPNITSKLVPLIHEYGRWDDYFELIGTPLQDQMVQIVSKQFWTDVANIDDDDATISLLAKWMPSINASSETTKERGKFFANALALSEKSYRRTLAALRRKLDVVERKMSANFWGDIKYSAVPSYANLRYADAFMRHDAERRIAYLRDVATGMQEMHAGVLYPHDVVAKYEGASGYNEAYEQLWGMIPNVLEDDEPRVITVPDTSGSMCCCAAGSVKAYTIAQSLALYFSGRCHGAFHNKVITFSNSPVYIDFKNCKTLYDKISLYKKYSIVANTNIKGVFDLIRESAVASHLKQEDLPGTILIMSDMEFDNAVDVDSEYSVLFEQIKHEYECAGYKLPKLVFWNILSRTRAVPLRENENGVILISGFSPNILRMVLSNQFDTFKALEELLMESKYNAVSKALGVN